MEIPAKKSKMETSMKMFRSLFRASSLMILGACAGLNASTLDFETLDASATSAYGINADGVIVGTSGSGGFIRASSGTYQYFNYANQQTLPLGINDAGYIVGSYGGYPYNAFLRAPDGSFVATAVNAAFAGINDIHTISGYTCPCTGTSSNFIRDSLGNFTYYTFSAALGYFYNFAQVSTTSELLWVLQWPKWAFACLCAECLGYTDVI